MLVDQLHLPLTHTANYGVIMGTRTAVKGKGVCKNVELPIGEFQIIESSLPVELGGLDVILGMQLLFTLGVIEVDWETMTMKVNTGHMLVTLRGDPNLTNRKVSLKQMIGLWT